MAQKQVHLYQNALFMLQKQVPESKGIVISSKASFDINESISVVKMTIYDSSWFERPNEKI